MERQDKRYTPKRKKKRRERKMAIPKTGSTTDQKHPLVYTSEVIVRKRCRSLHESSTKKEARENEGQTRVLKLEPHHL